MPDSPAAVSRITSSLTEQLGNPVALVAVFVLLGYLVITLDRRRDGSPSRDDTQVGIKLVIFGLMATAVLTTANATNALLAFVLGGFKGGWTRLRDPLASMMAAAGPAVGLYMLFLPRTNYLERPQVERLAVGLVSAFAGAGALIGLDAFLGALFAGAEWAEISAGLSAVGVWGGLAVLAIGRLGAMSGWRVIPRIPQMPMAPPMGGGMQPPPQGMPPLGGGYPPPGGYPPQQGGWPGQ